MSETLGWTAEAIRKARNPEGGPKVSQKELGRRLGQKQPTQVSAWERGLALPTVKSIMAVEEALDVKPGSLLTIRNDEWEMIHGGDVDAGTQLDRVLFRQRDKLTNQQKLEVIEFVDRLLAKDPPQDGGQYR